MRLERGRVTPVREPGVVLGTKPPTTGAQGASELERLRGLCTRLEGEAAALRERLQREEEQVRAIQAMGMALGSSLELDQVLRVILDAVTRLLDADRSSLFLVDDRREYLVSRIAQGQEDSEFRLRMGEGVAGWVARHGRPVNLKNAYEDRRFDPSFDQATGYRTRSLLCVPVYDPRRHRTVGVIQVLNKRQGYFSPADEELLRSVCSQAAITIENSKLFSSLMTRNMELLETRDQLQLKVREVDLLYELSRQIQQARTEEELASTVIEQALELLSCEAAALLLLDDEGGRLHYATRPVDATGRTGTLRLAPGEGLVGRAIRQGALLGSDGLKDDPGHRLRLMDELGISIRGTLAAPLVAEQRQHGALQVFNRKSNMRRFTAEDLKLLSLIADQTAVALDLRRQLVEKEQRERLATIGQLLSGVLHDIKGPISIISGYVQLMVKKEAREERERYAAIIHRQFEHLAAMTQEVLAFARGETTLLVRKCYVHRFMLELEELFRQQVEGRSIELSVRDDYGGVAFFDQVKLTRALVNLVRNSIEAMKKGGSLHILASREGNELIFTVSDTGAGIPEEIRGRLFGAFVTKGKSEGTGLGLAMVRKIVEEHGGSIRYESEAGSGTRFEIRLPQPVDVEEQETAAAAPGPAPSLPAGVKA